MTFSTDVVDRELAAVRGFNDREVGDLNPAQLHDASDALGRARRALDALVVSVAGEVGRRSDPDLGVEGLARREGYSTPQEFLANTLGTSTYEAKRLIDVGRAMAGDETERATHETSAPGALLDGGSPHAPGAPHVPETFASPHAPHSAPLPKYPLLAKAVNDGALGVEAAALVARTLDAIVPVMGAAADTTASADSTTSSVSAQVAALEHRLVEAAQKLSVKDFRRTCERERAWRAPQELVERERLHRERRTLFFGEDADGMTVMTAKMDAASAAPVKAWIEAQVRHTFQQRRKNASADGSDIQQSQIPGYENLPEAERQRMRAEYETDDRTAGQIRIDNLVMLAQHGLDCDTPTSGVKTTVVLRMNVTDLENDRALGECDQLSSPISVGTLRAMAVDAGVVPVVMGGDSLPLDMGRLRRYFTPAQRIAMAERDGGCSWCHAPPSFCEAHHIDWWAKQKGRSDIHNGLLLCVGCHHRIHRDGWGISIQDDQVWFQPSPIDGRARPPRIGGRAHLSLTV